MIRHTKQWLVGFISVLALHSPLSSAAPLAERSASACQLNGIPNIDGLFIGVTADEFLRRHPTAENQPNFAGNRNPRTSRLDFPMRNGVSQGELKGINSIGHIATLDGVAYSYSVSFVDAGADYDTPLETFKNMLVARYQLPDNGWYKWRGQALRLRCADIELEVHQDHGSGHTAIGPVFFARSLHLQKIADSLR